MGKKRKARSNRVWYVEIIILVLVVFVLYLPSLRYRFVWDDKELYINESNLPQEETFSAIPNYFVPKKDKMYIPITYTFWNIVGNLGGIGDEFYNSQPFHLFNLLLHTINSILVFFVLLRFLNERRFVFLGAVVFALHPIQVESVAWISEARGLLAGVFGFSALLLYLQGKTGSLRNYLVYLLLFCSMLSKPSGIVFPLILITLDAYLNGFAPFKEFLKRNIFVLLLIVPFIFLAMHGEISRTIEFSSPLWARPLLWLNAIGFYLLKVFIPLNFSACYGLTYNYLVKDVFNFYPILISIAVLLIGVILKKKWFWFVIVIFILGFFPVSNLLTYYYQYWSTVSDRYVYYSMFAFSFAISFIVKEYFSKYFYYICGIVGILLFLFSRSELPKWESDIALWNNCIEKYPNRVPHPYLGRGFILQENGNYSKALEDYNTAIELDSNYYFGYYNRGNLYYDLKQFNRAIEDYSKVLMINPKYVNAYVNRGLCLMEIRLFDDAIQDFTKSLELDPKQFDVYYERANCYIKLGQRDKAIDDLKFSLKLKPDFEHAKMLLRVISEKVN